MTKFLYAFLLIMPLLVANIAYANTQVARYDTAEAIPEVLRRKLHQGVYLEQYIGQIITMIRTNAADHNTLTQSDVDAFKERIKRQFQHQQLSQVIIYDTNHDTKVTKDELKETLLEQLRISGNNTNTEFFERRMEQLMKLDKDGDGVISYSEMYDTSDASRNYQFNDRYNNLVKLLELDPNKDNRLTVAEAETLARRAFYTLDENANGMIDANEVFIHKNKIPVIKDVVMDTPDSCSMKINLPENILIYGSGAYSGHQIDMQIDQSGHGATSMELVINQPDNPVALLLGAYEPTIWNIRTTPGTKIAAVVVGGYHRQILTGIDKTVPTKVTSYEEKSECGHFYFSKDKLDTLNPLARKFFNKPVTMFYPAENGKAVLGDKNYNIEKLSGKPLNIEEFRLKDSPLAGHAGLKEGVKKGFLRNTTPEDRKAWQDAFLKKSPLAEAAKDIPPVAGNSSSKPQVPNVGDCCMGGGYTVIKDGFTYPAGLYGGNSATFIILDGVKAPGGNSGHSAVYDISTGNCTGAICPRND